MNKLKQFLPISTVILFATAFALNSSSTGKSSLVKNANASQQTWKGYRTSCGTTPLTFGWLCFSGTDSTCYPINCPQNN